MSTDWCALEYIFFNNYNLGNFFSVQAQRVLYAASTNVATYAIKYCWNQWDYLWSHLLFKGLDSLIIYSVFSVVLLCLLEQSYFYFNWCKRNYSQRWQSLALNVFENSCFKIKKIISLDKCKSQFNKKLNLDFVCSVGYSKCSKVALFLKLKHSLYTWQIASVWN